MRKLNYVFLLVFFLGIIPGGYSACSGGQVTSGYLYMGNITVNGMIPPTGLPVYVLDANSRTVVVSNGSTNAAGYYEFTLQYEQNCNNYTNDSYAAEYELLNFYIRNQLMVTEIAKVAPLSATPPPPTEFYHNFSYYDSSAPSAPSNIYALEINVTNQSIVQLNWTTSTDNIWYNLSYSVYRGNSSSVSYTDTLIQLIYRNGTGTMVINDTLPSRGGTYFYTVYANDTSGNRGSRGTPANVTVTNLVPAQVTGAAVVSNNHTLNFSWTAVTTHNNGAAIGLDLSGYRVYSNMSGSWIVIMATNNTYYYNNTVTNSVTYFFKVSAYDSDGNGGVNSSVAYGTPSERPSITAVPANTINKPGVGINVTVTSGQTLSTVYYRAYNTSDQVVSNITNASVSGTSLVYYISASSWIENMVHIIAVFANDTNGQITQQNFTYKTDNTAPGVSGSTFSDSDSIVKSTDSRTFNVSVSDANPMSGVTFGVVGTEVSMANTTPTLYQAASTASVLGCTNLNGACTIKFISTDIAGNINNSHNFTFIVDNVAPSVWNAVVDDSDSYVKGADNFQVNVSVQDANAILYVNVSRGIYSYLLSNITATIFSRSINASAMGCTGGSCILNFSAIDVAGNANSTTATIIVDNTAPSVYGAQTNDSDNKVKSTDVIRIFVNVSDANLSTVTMNGTTLVLNGTNMYATINSSAQFGCNTTGSCILSFSATDIVGNVNSSTTLTLTIDDTPPGVFAAEINDADNIVRTNASIIISVNATDVGSSVYNVSVNNTAMTQSGNRWSLTTTPATIGCAATGSCIVTFSAIDIVGNLNNSVSLTFTADNIAPVVSFVRPLNYTNTSSALINFNITDNYGIDNSTITVSGASGFSVSGCSGSSTALNCTFSATGLSQGYNTVVVSAYDKAGNIKTNATVFVYDTLGPNVFAYYSPATTPTTPSDSIVMVYMINDTWSQRSNGWYEIDDDGTYIVLNFSLSNITLSGLSAGAHSLVVYANDSFNNNNNYSAGNFYVNSLVNLTEYVDNIKSEGRIANVSLYLSNGTLASGVIFFNQTLTQIIAFNSTFANITINISLFGTNINTGGADEPSVDINTSGAMANSIAGRIVSSFNAFVMYENMSKMIEDDAYLSGSGVAQWVRIMIQRPLGTMVVVYMGDDTGSEIYTLGQCANNNAPSPPSSIVGSCYINSSTYVEIFVPHLSGVGLVEPSAAPVISVVNPVSTITNSYFNLSGYLIDLNLNAGTCNYQLYNGSNITIGSLNALSVVQSLTNEANYSFSVSNDVNFENLNNGTYLNLSVNCTSIDGNSSKVYRNFFISDTTKPVFLTQTISGTESSSSSDTMVVAWTTDEYAKCGYNASNLGQALTAYNGALTNLSAGYSKTHQYSKEYAADGILPVPNIICIDKAGNSQISANTTLNQTVSVTEDDSVNNTGRGTGGGVALKSAPLESITKVWVSMVAGVNEMKINEIAIPFTSIKIDLKNALSNVELKIIVLAINPETESPTDNVYKFLQIEEIRITNTDLNKADIAFRVDKAWFANKNIKPDNVALFRFNEKWTELKTTRLLADENYEYYSAESPGLSVFAIAGKVVAEAPVEVPKEQPKPIEEPKVEEKVVVPEPVKEEIMQQQQPKGKVSLIFAVLIVVILLIIGALLLFKGKKKP